MPPREFPSGIYVAVGKRTGPLFGFFRAQQLPNTKGTLHLFPCFRKEMMNTTLEITKESSTFKVEVNEIAMTLYGVITAWVGVRAQGVEENAS